MAEITNKGFIPTTQNEYFEEQRQLLLDIDPEWNLDPSTPDALKIAHDAEVFGNLDETLQAAYNSKDPNKATGSDLATIALLTGTERSLGTPGNVDMLLTGVAGTVVNIGTLFDSGQGTPQWGTDSTVTISPTGTVSVTATCTENGAIEADVNSITNIVTVVGGLQSVTNTAVPTLGTDKQSDPALRIERAQAVGRPGNNQIDSLLGELFAVEDVRRVRVYENFTNVTDSNGLPHNSIAAIVDGGTDYDVAKAIFIKKNPGCALYAAGTLVSVPDVYGPYPTNAKTIVFSRPIGVNQVVVITVKDDGSLPSNVSDLIKDSILDYTDGTLLPSDIGFNIRGYDIGQDVPVNQLATPVNKVIGQYGYSYIEGLTVNGLQNSLSPIAFNELARFSSSNITVVLT